MSQNQIAVLAAPGKLGSNLYCATNPKPCTSNVYFKKQTICVIPKISNVSKQDISKQNIFDISISMRQSVFYHPPQTLHIQCISTKYRNVKSKVIQFKYFDAKLIHFFFISLSHYNKLLLQNITLPLKWFNTKKEKKTSQECETALTSQY